MRSVFYWIESHNIDMKYASWVDGDVHFEPVGCSMDDRHLRIKQIPLNVVLPDHSVEDFVWTWYSELMIQEHVLRFFQEQGFSGYTTLPAKCCFKGKKTRSKPPALLELKATGWGGMAAPESGIRLLDRCPGCGRSGYSSVSNPARLIDAAQWDGSDFFMVWPLPRYIFLSERAANVLRFAKFKGIGIVPVSKIGTGSSGFSPGRLADWMEPERARLLGAPLGIT